MLLFFIVTTFISFQKHVYLILDCASLLLISGHIIMIVFNLFQAVLLNCQISAVIDVLFCLFAL